MATTTAHPTHKAETEKVHLEGAKKANLEMEKKGSMTTSANLLEDLRHDMEAFWERPFQMFFQPFTQPFARTFRNFKTTTTWMPTVDVFEKEGELIVKADLPGLEKENVHVTMEENDLVLFGERKFEKETKEENYYRSESNYGEFYRRLELPFDADPTLIAANFKNGILEVKIPIPVGSKPEAHPIKIN